MNVVDVITKKRDGRELSAQEIRAFVQGAVDGSWRDYQLSALLMAIYLNGMSDRETVDLTMAMAHSGRQLELSGIEGVKVDKHSTGGVGDTTTLILAPLVAACGVKLVKMSGRGLGHTGGTLDKIESIPGMSTGISIDQLIAQVNQIGCAVAGQTADLAPADKTLYALRDVTGTVESLPLVVSSILSKKLAANCDVVVLDVKTGSGAIMPTAEKSIELARTMVRIGCMTGRKFSALVTDMSQPLGMYIGNALEVEEAILALSGRAPGALLEVSLQLGAHILLGAGVARTLDEARERLENVLQSGAGLRKLAEMIRAQGGDPQTAYDPSLLPHAERSLPFAATRDGYLCAMQTAHIGNAAKALGAGRERKEDAIDPSVGLIMKKRIGDYVHQGEELCELRVSVRSDVARARALLGQAFVYSDEKVTPPPLIHAVIGAEE